MSGYKLNILGFLVHIAHKTIKNIISLHKKRQKGSGSCLVFYHTYRHLHSIKSQSSSDSLSEILSKQSFLFVITSETQSECLIGFLILCHLRTDWYFSGLSSNDTNSFWVLFPFCTLVLLLSENCFAYRVNEKEPECFLMVRRGHNRVQIKLPRNCL